MAGWTYSQVIVFTFTTCTIPSDEGQMSIIRARSHFPLGKFSSFKSTIVPGSMFVWCTFHLPLDCNVGRYSISYLFQNWLDIATTCFHLLQLDMSPSFSSITAPLLYLPNKRWFDVSSISKRLIVDNCFDLCEYCHQLKVCQNCVFDHAEHNVFDCSYYSFPYSSLMRTSRWIEMPNDLFVRWIFVDSFYFDVQFACSSL